MTYYAFIQDNKINGTGQCPVLNEDIISFEITEEVYNNIDHYIWDGSDVVLNPNYDEEQSEKRRENFYKEFMATSKGNYRLQPKGYANAQQSIDTIHNIVMASGGLNEQIANMVIFYETPDFDIPEQCTEEWLVQHQIHPEPMTLQEWVPFYIEFCTLYAQSQYRQ